MYLIIIFVLYWKTSNIHRYYLILIHLLTCKVETIVKNQYKQNVPNGKRDNVDDFSVHDRLFNTPFFYCTKCN